MGRSRSPAVSPLAIALATILATARGAPAEEPAERTTGLVAKDGKLLASVGMADLFGPQDRKRLTSGFVSRVLVRVYLSREGEPEPLWTTFQAGEIAFDLWNERFQVKITRPGGARILEVGTSDEALKLAASLWQFPIADLARLDPGVRYRIAFRADLNPISEELVAEMRRWLVRPPSGQRPGDSFFGSFVSIFVNPRIEDSERQLRFFSQPFVLPRGDRR